MLDSSVIRLIARYPKSMLPDMLIFLNKNLPECLQCELEPPLLKLGCLTVGFVHLIVFDDVVCVYFKCLKVSADMVCYDLHV